MRYDNAHKRQTREKVLKAAGQAIRREGVQNIGVASVMAEAGLTHGGFYAHFDSKDAFIAAAVDQMFADGDLRGRAMQGQAPAQGLARYIRFYLSRAHRDTETGGCPLPFLSGDAPRLTRTTRDRFARGVDDVMSHLVDTLTEMGQAEPVDDAAAIVTSLVGAVALARAEPDDAKSNQILASAQRALLRSFNLPDPN